MEPAFCTRYPIQNSYQKYLASAAVPTKVHLSDLRNICSKRVNLLAEIGTGIYLVVFSSMFDTNSFHTSRFETIVKNLLETKKQELLKHEEQSNQLGNLEKEKKLYNPFILAKIMFLTSHVTFLTSQVPIRC
jgi:hypothetical protein